MSAMRCAELHFPHRGIDLGVPVPDSGMTSIPPSLNVDRRDVLGGLIHEYHPVAA
jgi:hypothetical protein